MLDVCTCGHLEQSHAGACHAPDCDCVAFTSEDDVVELDEAA
jgi:hypothetical protein